MGTGIDALRAAIDGAWLAFKMPAPDQLGLCTECCISPAEADRIRATPARNLTTQQIRAWYGSAFASDPTHAQVVWLLPRVFELLAEGAEVAAVGNEVAFQRLARTGFPDRWPERQVAAVNAFALAYLSAQIASVNALADGGLDRLLCMFGEGGIDLIPLLSHLNALPDDVLVSLLHKAWFHHGFGTIPQNHFWSKEPGISLVRHWYRSDALLLRMEQAAMNGSELALDLYTLLLGAGGQAAP